MDIITIHKHLNCELPSASQIEEFENIANAYPWFSACRMLLLKAYKEADDPRFDDELPIAALYSQNRRALRKFLEQTSEQKNKTFDKVSLTEHTALDNRIYNLNDASENKTRLLLYFSNDYFGADNEYIEINNATQDELISRFIKDNPRIVPKYDEQSDNAVQADEQEEPVSEALAEIYASQGFYDSAIDCYKKLILIYPEKSAYFAGLIAKSEKQKI